MSRRLAFLLLGWLLLTPSMSWAADGLAERVVAIVVGRDMPESMDPETIEARLSSIVKLIRKSTTPVILFTDWGPGRAEFVRNAVVEFVPKGRARMQIEFVPSSELSLARLGAAIEAKRGAPGEKLDARWSWATPQGHVRLFTSKARGTDDNVLVLELWRDP